MDGHLLYLAVTEPECQILGAWFFSAIARKKEDAARRDTQSVRQGMIPDTALYDVVAAGQWRWYSESHAYEQVLFLQVQLLLISWMERRGETRRGEEIHCACVIMQLQVPHTAKKCSIDTCSMQV